MGNYVDKDDLVWPSGYTDEEKEEDIAKAEQLVEKITGTYFYEKDLDIELNGNGKNRVFPPIRASLLSVQAVYVCGVQLPPSWFDFDASSVFLDVCSPMTSGFAWAELYYRIGGGKKGIFPRGYNNIRIVGTSGYSSVPVPIKNAVGSLVESIADGTFETKGAYTYEQIGRYTYKIGVKGYVKEGVYTGIPSVDKILAHYVKQRKTRFMTP